MTGGQAQTVPESQATRLNSYSCYRVAGISNISTLPASVAPPFKHRVHNYCCSSLTLLSAAS